jgi:aryl-alcohol dehydrogenase-like predicted oxidoreductase
MRSDTLGLPIPFASVEPAMHALEPVQLGRSGLMVSPLCLGTMNFGEPGKGHQGDWTLPFEQAKPIVKAALDHGLFYFDTANLYGLGACEEVIGRALRELVTRDEYVLATKVFMPMGRGPNQRGLSRKHVMESIDASLRRLGLDYVDQLVIHRHPHALTGVVTPIEETMEALHDVVKAGKALYLGASTMFAWQLVELQAIAAANGWTRFVSMQNHYNLVYREEEREMNPYCASHGIALTPWSPLARGILAGAYGSSLEGGTTDRSKGADRLRTQMLYQGDFVFDIAARVAEVAERHRRTPAQIALAWLYGKPEVTAPVVGVSRKEQLDQLVEATTIELDPDDVEYLEALYAPVQNLLSIGGS